MDKKVLGLKESLEVIRHFRPAFEALADERVLRLLGSLDSEVVSNSEARAFLGVSKKSAWLVLAKLEDLGVVQRHGYSYTVTPSTFEMARTFASALRGLVSGRTVSDSNLSALVADLGHDFIEWAYNRGKIDRDKFLEYEKQLNESKEETRNGR